MINSIKVDPDISFIHDLWAVVKKRRKKVVYKVNEVLDNFVVDNMKEIIEGNLFLL